MLPLSEHRLTPLLSPRSVAVVGASPKPESFGWSSYRALVDAGYEGDIHLVNPRYDAIDARPCVPTLSELSSVDHAMLVVSNALLESVLDDAIAAGIPAVTIFASAYLEGDHDPPLLERLKTKARAAGLLVCGGNGIGFWNRDHKVCCALVGYGRENDVGSITLIAQSGSIYGSLMQNDGRLAFNLSVSSGQELTTTTADYMDYALELPSTRAIGLFMESVRDPATFMAVAEKARSAGVRVVTLKVARSEAGARMALSHSGALAGNDEACSAAFERAGVVRVRDVEELVATLQLATQPRAMIPGGLVAITDSGGEREHLADLAVDAGVPFAEIGLETRDRLAARLDYGLDPDNPLDAWGTGKDYVSIFADCFSALVADDNAALGMWVADLRDGQALREPFISAASAVARSTPKPVVFASCVPQGVAHETARRLRELGIPLIDGLGPALAAVSHAMSWEARDRAPPVSPPAPPPGETVAHWRARLVAGPVPDEAEGLHLLRDFGLATVEALVVEDEDAAGEAAERLGLPVAVKTAIPGVAHKTDVGGVSTGLATTEAVRSAYRNCRARLGARCVVESMAPPGVEMMFGLTRDPHFGPLVVVGAGGVLAELIEDVAHAIPPFDAAEARRLIARLRACRLLAGARGRPAADLEALAEALARFSVLAATLGDRLDALDVNPVIAGPRGAFAADVLVAPRHAGPHHAPEA